MALKRAADSTRLRLAKPKKGGRKKGARKPGKTDRFLHLLSIIIHTRNAATNTTRTPFSGWTVMQINAASVALDKFHAKVKNGKKNPKTKTTKSEINLEYICVKECTHTDVSHARTENQLSSLLSVLMLSFSSSHLLRNSNYIFKQIQLRIGQLLKANSRRLSPSLCAALSPLCRWINARSFQRPSDSPVN